MKKEYKMTKNHNFIKIYNIRKHINKKKDKTMKTIKDQIELTISELRNLVDEKTDLLQEIIRYSQNIQYTSTTIENTIKLRINDEQTKMLVKLTKNAVYELKHELDKNDLLFFLELNFGDKEEAEYYMKETLKIK